MSSTTPPGSPDTESYQRLLIELEDLRSRLDAAEQALRAAGRPADVSSIPGGDAPALRRSEPPRDGTGDPTAPATRQDVLVQVSSAGRILSCNRRFSERLKAPLDGLLGRPLDAFLPLQERAHWGELLTRALDSPTGGRLVFQDAEGHSIPWDLSADRLNGAQGPCVCLRASDAYGEWDGSTRLKSPREQQGAMEEALRRERHLAGVLEHSSQPFAIGRVDGSIALTNRASQELLGYEREELCTLNWITDLTPPEWHEPERLALEELHRSGRPARYEKELLRKDGSRVPVQMLVHLVRDGDGRPACYQAFAADISERKRWEQALGEREARHRLLIENMLNALAYCRMQYEQGRPVDWTYLEVNPAFAALTGLEDVVGRRVTEAAPGLIEGNPELLEIYGDVASTGQARRFEIFVKTLDRWLAIAAYSPVPGHFAVVFDVITERKRSEQALRRSEKRYRTLFETMTEGVIYQHADGPIIDANTAAEQILGRSRGELCGKQSTDYDWRAIHPDGRAFPGCDLPTMVALRTGQEVRDVLMGVFNPVLNETRWLLVGATPVFEPGQVDASQVYCVFRDVTERIEAERAIEASEARVRAYFDLAADAVFVHDFQGRLVDVNRQACASLGYGREELLGKAVFDVERDFTLETAQRTWAEILPGQSRTLSGHHRRHDGSTFPVEIRSCCFEAEGRRRYLALARDITEREEAEARLRERDELLQITGEIARLGGWEVDLTSGEVRWTEEVDRIFDLESGAESGVEFGMSFFTEDSRPLITTAFQDACRRAIPYDLELEIVSRKGETKQVRAKGVPVLEAGRVVKVRGILQDITEQKRIRESLRESQERLEAIVNTAADAILTIDDQGLVDSFNPAAERMFGYGAEEMRGQSVSLLMPASFPGDHAAFIDRYQRTGHSQVIGAEREIHAVRRDGSEFPIEIGVREIHVQGRRLFVGIVHDLTARKRAEEALRRSEEQYRRIVETAQEGVWVHDLEGRTSFVNARMAVMLGYTPAEMQGKPVAEFLDPDLRPDFARLIERRRDGLCEKHDLRFEHRDGRVLWAMVSASVLRDDEGRVVGVLKMVTDITDRRRAEQEIRDLNERLEQRVAQRTAELESMLNHATVGLAFFDRECRFVRVNEVLAQLNRRTLQEHLGRSPREVCPEIADQVEANVARVVSTGQPIPFEELRSPARDEQQDGSWMIGYFPVRSADGSVFSVGVSLADISAQKRVETQLAELNRSLKAEIAERERAEQQMRRLTAILESAPDFVGLADSELRVVYYNRAAMQALGRVPDQEAFGITDVHPEGMDRFVLETALPIACRDGVWRGEIELLARDGRIIPVSQVVLAHRDADGRLAYYSTIMRDMTDQRAMERALRRQAEELARANMELARASRMKDEFLANMSHELRTPLNGVLSMAQALDEEVYGPVTSQQRQAIADIESSGRHLLAIITDILDLTRIEAGTIECIPDTTEVGETCKAAMRMVSQMAKSKRQRTAIDLDPRVSCIVTDERRLKQILVNLLSNAVKFTPEGGSIGLEMRGDASRGRLRFAAWDTGIGIADEHLEAIFEPFTQVDSGLARQYSGAGLGLALVRQMTHLLGGEISVSSTPGKGSRFTLELDWVEPSTSESPVDAPVAAGPAVEGRPGGQRLVGTASIAETLAGLGIPAMIYPLGIGALQRIRESRPGVLLIEGGCDEPSVWDLLGRLADDPDPRLRDIHVVLLSGDAPEPSAIPAGRLSWLRTPCTHEAFRSVVSPVSSDGSGHVCALLRAPAPAAQAPSDVVLLAEDDAINARSVLDFLQTQGLCVALARDGHEAVEKAVELLPRAILMDVHLPGLDGLEAMRRIKANPSTAEIPIVAITALAMAGDRVRCLDAGAEAYLSKPFALRELLDVLRAILTIPDPENPRGASRQRGQSDPDR